MSSLPYDLQFHYCGKEESLTNLDCSLNHLWSDLNIKGFTTRTISISIPPINSVAGISAIVTDVHREQSLRLRNAIKN